MVNHCLICKSAQGEIVGVSFHSFLTDEIRRKCWLTAINKNEIAKISHICSQHLKKTDFNYEQRSNKIFKTVKADAVPSLFSNENNLNLSNNGNQIIHSPVNSKAENSSDVCINVLSQLNPNNQLEIERNEADADKFSDMTDNQIIVDEVICIKGAESLKRINESEPCSSGVKRTKTLRYIGDLRPEDFTSMIAYEVVKKYYKANKKKLKVKNQNICRLNIKIKNHQDVLNHLQECGLITKEGFDALQVSLRGKE